MSAETKKGGFMKFMEEKFLPVAAKLGGQRHLLALRDGVVMVMPLLILGAFSMIIAEFPVEAFINFMARVFGENWNAFEGVIMHATYGIVSVVACFGVARSLVNSYDVDGTPAGIIAMSAFFAIIVPSSLVDDAGETVEAWIAGSLDATLLFTALLTALIVGEIYRLLVQKNFTIKLPDSVPKAVSAQFTALLPGTVIIVIFTAIRLLFAATPWGGFPEFVTDIISTPLRHLGTSYIGTLIACFFEHLLWFFGLHGSAIIIFPIFEPLWLMNMAENISDGARNIVTFTFYENGVWIGGSGATLPVVIYMLFCAKSKLLKNVGKVGIAPGIFNINEPVTFGLPVVLNPILMIPYILSPIAAMTVQYIGTAIGLFPLCNNMVPWTCPILISGFLSTGSIMGTVAQLCGMAVSFLIWLPFIRVWDKKCYNDELASIEAKE
ncbi:PTS system, cellobiose-specific IIC component [Lachnospiraceae bacterium G11]|jgi:PTS system cellobiose-specific IIC component|nr:PTS sugar transporter subunit IIC [Lachnospiraceae bacterium]SDA74705.1 PTS system, cellobiose-specific IIC component [Lachnospiraceae bacterium G11]